MCSPHREGRCKIVLCLCEESRHPGAQQLPLERLHPLPGGMHWWPMESTVALLCVDPDRVVKQ